MDGFEDKWRKTRHRKNPKKALIKLENQKKNIQWGK